MSRLHTKLIRDLWAGRWQFAAVVFVVCLGVLFFTASYVAYENLKSSYQLSYERLRFADFSVACDSAPEDVVAKIARQRGIIAAVGRIVEEVGIDQPGRAQGEVVGRIISLPTGGQPAVNDVQVTAGRYFSRRAKREALVEASFAKYQGYRPGDTIRPVVFGEQVPFRIVGLVQSPEYIFAVRNKQYLMSTPDMFGVLFIPHEEAERLLDSAGRINEVVVRATPDRRDALMRATWQTLRPFGAEEPTPREEQPSNKLLQMDLDEFRELGVIFPLLFLTAAGLTTYSLLMRMVHAQRTQIGFLRASGYARGPILRHYLGFALLVGLVGGGLGTVGGHFLSRLITYQYVTMLNIPFMAVHPRWAVMAGGLALGLVSCLLAGLSPARAAANLPPAVAMRPEPPTVGRRPLLERLFPALSRLSFVWKIPFRNLFRSRRRTLSTIGGIAMAISLILVFAAFLDATEAALQLFFRDILRYDLRAELIPPQSGSVVATVSQWKGVRRVEETLDVPVEIRRGNVLHSTILIGVRPDQRLYGLTDPTGRPIPLREEAVILTEELREKLGVEEGDRLLLRYPQSADDRRLERWTRVGPALQLPFGSLIFLPLNRVRAMFAGPLGWPTNATTSLMLTVEERYLEEVRQRLDKLDGVAAVESIPTMRQQVDELLRFTYVVISVMLLFGMGMAFAIVFNTMSINVLERTRELATLRTLGLDRRRLARLLTIENLLHSFLGVLVGVPFGRLLATYIFRLYENEMINLRLVIFPRSYLLTVLGIILAVLISQIPGLRYVNTLDLAKATKEQTG
jgi:putative ABC transport system permease protein